MFCTHCGAQIDEDSKFCPICGAACILEPVSEEMHASKEITDVEVSSNSQISDDYSDERIDILPDAGKAPALQPISVADTSHLQSTYYTAEFAKIAAGQKSKFNWAAFFLGPFHQLYHGSIRLFKKTFLPYMIAMLVTMAVGQISTLITLATFSTGALILTIVTVLLYLITSVWALIKSTIKDYMSRYKGAQKIFRCGKSRLYCCSGFMQGSLFLLGY